MSKTKPIKWEIEPDIGYSATRRPDGGLTVVFTHLDDIALEDWRNFAHEHQLDSDRLTRNLYDLRSLKALPQKAILTAVEVNSDPATRNLRVAVVVSSLEVQHAVEEIAALSSGEGAEMRVFMDIDRAEEWLSQPVDTLP